MVNIHRFRIFPWLFFMFGVPIFIPVDKSASPKLLKMARCVPHIISLLFIGVSSYVLLQSAFNRPHSASLYIIGWFQILSNFIMIFICIKYPKAMKNIYQQFSNAFDKVENSLEFKVEISSFRRRYQCKIVANIVVYILIYAIKWLSLRIPAVATLSSSSDFLDFVYFIHNVYRHVATLWVVLFINLIEFLLNSLNAKLNSMSSGLYLSDSNGHELLSIFRCIKTVHFYLHNVSMMIADAYGWFNTSVFLNFVSSTVINVFWVYIHMASTDNFTSLTTIRKYLNLSSFCFYFNFTTILRKP